MDPQIEQRLLAEKLDTLIQLISVGLTQQKTQKEQILLLSSAGLPPKRIAHILATTPNTVKVTLAKMRKVKRGNNGHRRRR